MRIKKRPAGLFLFYDDFIDKEKTWAAFAGMPVRNLCDRVCYDLEVSGL